MQDGLPEVTDYPMGPPGGGDLAPKPDDGDALADAYTAVSDAAPDQAAKVMRLSEKTGISPQDVHGNEGEVGKLAAAPTREQFKDIALRHPVVGKFLSDPVNMAQAYDDTENLVAHSHANKELERSHGIADAIATGLENSILGMTFRNKTPDMALGEDATFAEKFTSSAAQFVMDYPFMAAGGVAGGMIGAGSAGLYLGPASATPAGVAAIEASAAAGSAVGGFAFPDAYRTALRQHMESGDEASALDLLKQVFTLNTLKSGLKGAVTGLATAGAGAVAKPFGAVAVGGAEVAAMTTVGAGEAAIEGKKQSFSGVLEDAASNSLLIGMMHGAGVLGNEGLDRAFPQRVADTIRVETTRDAASLLDKSSKASKLRARDPKGFEQLMNQGKPVMIPVERYESYFQNKGMDPGQVSNDLGASASYEYARQHGDGESVVIPQGKWLGEGMDAHRSALSDDIKFNQDHLTANEYKLAVDQQKEFAKARDEFIKKNGEDAAAAVAASEPARLAHADIAFDVKQRLEATKQFPKGLATPEARDAWLTANSKRVADYFIAESARRKVDPRQLYAKEGPRLTGGGAAARAATEPSLPQGEASASGGTPSEDSPTPQGIPGASPAGSSDPTRSSDASPYYTRPELQTHSLAWSITDNPAIVKSSREERFNALMADEAKAYGVDPTNQEFRPWIVNRARNNIQRGYKMLAMMRDMPQRNREILIHSMQRDQERLDLMSGIHPDAHVDFMGKPLNESLSQESGHPLTAVPAYPIIGGDEVPQARVGEGSHAPGEAAADRPAGGAGEARLADDRAGLDARDGSDGEGAGRSGLPSPVRGRPEPRHAEPLSGQLPKNFPGPSPEIRLAAELFSRHTGLPVRQPSEFVLADPERGRRIADAFAEMAHRPNDPEVKQAYDALIRETISQLDVMRQMGVKFEAIPKGEGNRYANSAEMVADARSGHLWYFSTKEGFGSGPEAEKFQDHPLYAETNEKDSNGQPMLANDVFRVVHDFFGHAKEGNGFGANGEENAWQSHVRMYSPEAARAMTSETRGQNSWVNFHPDSEANRTKPGSVYADQKAGLLPRWVTEKYQAQDRIDSLRQDAPNDELADASYSKLIQTLDQKIRGKTATVEQVKALASNFKEDERKWTGFDKFMDGKSGKIDKKELIDFLNANRLQVEERVLGEKIDENNSTEMVMPSAQGEPTEAEFRAWGEEHSNHPDIINASWRDHLRGLDHGSYADFLEHRRVEAGGNPSVDTLDDEDLEEKVREQYEDEINERANEKESENIDSYMDDNASEWQVRVEQVDREAEDINDINEEVGLPNHWLVDFDNGHSRTYEAESEDAAREMAEKELRDGVIPNNSDGYKLVLNGDDYTPTERRNGVRVNGQSFFDDESDAQSAADDATDRESERYRENMWGNSDGSEYREALDEFIEEVQNGERPLDGYENGTGESKSKTPAKKEFKWDKARWPSTGSYTTPGAIPGSEREIVFHAPALEKFSSDRNHFGDISEQRIGWMRTSLHKSDKGSVVRLSDENQNDRTQKGAAEGYDTPEMKKAYIAWRDEGNPLYKARINIQENAANLRYKINTAYREGLPPFVPITELPPEYNLVHDSDPNQIARGREWGVARTGGSAQSITGVYHATEKEAVDAALTRINEDEQYGRTNTPAFREAQLNNVEQNPEYAALREQEKALQAQIDAHEAKEPKNGSIPDTPFKNNWQEFQWKRFLRWHIEQDYLKWQASASGLPFVDWWKDHGIKQVAWTTGMQQAERNNRAEDVDKLVYDPVKQELSAFKNKRAVINGSKMAPDEIAEKLGGSPQAHEIVKRLLATEPVKSLAESGKTAYEPKIDIIHEPGTDSSYPYKLMLDGEEYNRMATQESANGERDELLARIKEGTESTRKGDQYKTDESNHVGSHVIHDEGGIKVAANAKFYQDLYDIRIPSFLKKFTKQWGVTMGEAMLATGEQHGLNRYEGDEPGMFALNKIGREIAGDTDDRMKRSLAVVMEDMKAGKTFAESIARNADSISGDQFHRLAEKFGGKLVKDLAVRHERFHALNLTPEIAQAAITQGFPLFQGDGANPQGEYVPARNEIRLHSGSDETTFMHEFAHGALQHMFEFVKSGQADESYLQHFGAMKDFLGIKDSQDSLTREQHEKFARGWERYLRGEQDQKTKAPTKELQGAYDLFRKWFSKVYKQIKGSPIEGNLTPEAREFFDRMVATEEQIAQAAQETGYKGGEIESIEGLDPATQKKHRTLQERARDAAENAMLKDNMADLQAERKLTLDAERERQTKALAPEVAEHPLYRASQDVEENRPGAHRSAASLSDDFLAGKLSAQEAGAFESAAAVHGFSDGRDLAESIKADAEKGGQAGTLKRRVDDAMKPFDGNSDQLKEAALKNIHERQMTELLALEQQILGDMQHDQEVRSEVAKRRRVSASMAAADAKQKAKDFLATRPLKDAAAFRSYITAERNAAVKVSKAIAAGDFEEAAKAKGQQMLSHALAAEAMKNKAEINRKGRFLDKFIKRGQDMLGMPYGFVTKIDDMLVAHGLMEPRDPAMQATLQKNAETMAAKGESAAEIANATGLVQDASGKWARESLEQFVARVNDDYYPISLPDSVMGSDSLSQKNPNMTLAELRDLNEAVKIVNQIGTGFERFLSDFIKGDLKTNAAAFKAQVEKNIGTPHGNVPALGELDMNKLEKAIAAIKATPDGFIADKVNLLTLCEYLDRLAPDGEAKKNIYRPLRGAENREIEMRAEYSKRLEALREKHYSKDEIGRMGDESFASWEIQTPDGPKKVRLTKENALVMLLNRGSESNLDRLTRGFGVDEHKIQEITDGLDKRDHDFAQDVWRYVDQLWPEASALEMKINGMEPKKVKAQPVPSRHGTYEGGYFPLAYDYDKSADAYKNAEQRNALYKQFSTAAAHTEQGALKERVKSLDRPVKLTFDGLFNHLDNVIHDISYRPSVIDVSRFLNQPDAKNAIVNAIGIDGYQKIGADLKAAASAQGDFLTNADKKMRWFRFSTTLATLGYRLAVFPRRMTEDVVNSMREVGFRNTIGSTADYVVNPTTIRDFVREKSPLMRERAVNRERDLMDMSRQWSGRESKIKQFAFLQDTIADQAMSYPVWKSVYDKNVTLHGDVMARQLADESIIKTFGSGSEIDRVGAQRGSELNRLVSMYYSWHSMMFNRAWLQGKIAGLDYNEGNFGKALATIAATTATTWVIPAATDLFWHEVLHNSPNGQETDDEKKKRRLSTALEAPFAYFPIARSAAQFVIPLALGEHPHGGYQLSPAESAIENVLKTIGHGAAGMFDPDAHYDSKFAEEAARTASIMVGSPQQLMTLVFNFRDYLNGEGELTWRDLVSRRAKK